MKKLISIALCFMLVFTMFKPVFADSGTVAWTGAVNNSWHEPGNWSPQRVPGPGDTAVIPDEARVVISNDTNVTLDCSGEITVEAGANLTLTGSNHLRDGGLFGPGSITITGEGSELIWFKGGIDGEGALIIDSGARLVIDTEFNEIHEYHITVLMYRPLINNGLVAVERGDLLLIGGSEGTGSFTIAEDTWLSLEEGEFDINGDIVNEGFFIVWTEGAVNFNADYRQGNTGCLKLNLLTNDSESYNKVRFNGNVELDGKLELLALDLSPGDLLSPGDSFEIMTYASRTGEFAKIILSPFNINLVPTYGNTSLMLTIPQDDIALTLVDIQPANGTIFPPYTTVERLQLEFSEPVWGGSSDTEEKKLYIYEEGQEDPIFEVVLSPDDDWPSMYGNGDSLITVEFGSITLESGKTYYILIDEGGFVDWAGNRYPGISDSSNWSFSLTEDNQPPTAPANLRCASKNSSRITLQWDPSTDDYGAVMYRIYGKEDGDEHFVYIGETSSTTYTLTKLSSQRYLSSSTTYVFYVQAVDDRGNESEQSNSLAVTTSPPPQLQWDRSFIAYFEPVVPFSMYYDFTYGDGKYYVVGTHRTILSNYDLINNFWTLEYGPQILEPELKGVAYSNGRLVAVGGSSVYSKTSDGNWTISKPGSGTATLEDIAVGMNKETGGDIFVAVGPKQIWWSENGVDWESCSLPYKIQNSDCRFYAVEADEQGNFIAVGCVYDSYSANSTLLICKSTNGKDWYTTLVSSATGQLTGLAYGNGTFVASGGSVPEVLISHDTGSSWVRSETTGTTYTDIAYGDGLFVGVVGKNIYISENEGHTWSPAGDEFEFYLRTIDFCNGTFLLAGEGDHFFYAIVENDEPTLSSPSAPRNLTADSGDGQVTLTWDPPQSDGGDSITHYEVSCDNGLTWVTAVSNSTHTFTNLTNDVEYTFKVRAVNSVGHGAAASIKATPTGEFAGGSGTEEDPYLISTVNHLNNVRNYLDKHFRLIANLDMGAGDHGEDDGWEPIGTQSEPFTGYFDGDGHTISNLYINRITEAKIGLFGYTDESATILDLVLENVCIRGNVDVGGLVGYNEGVISKVQATGNVTGRGETGGLVGSNYGLIVESRFEGTVTDNWGGYVGGLAAVNYGRISKCHVDAVVTSSSSFVGGLVGSNYSVINMSSATGIVEGSGYVGGLVGSNNNGNIDLCYASGSVTGTEDWINYTFVGGLVGYNRSSISNSYARGIVSGTEAVGGLVGYNASIGSISKCYSTGPVDGSTYTGGLVGYGHDDGIIEDSYWDVETSLQENSIGGTGKSTDEMKQRETYENWDFADLWGINDSENDGYPFLLWQLYEAMPVVPSKPRNLTAVPGDGEVELSWSAPADVGESGIIRYEVCKNGDADWTDVGLNTSYTFTGLTNGVEYTFYVRAVNSVGAGVAETTSATPVAPPVPTYTVTMTNGTGSGEYPQGATVSITANPAPEGKRFREWQVIRGEISLENPAQPSTSFIMPASAVELTAVYEDIPSYPVTEEGSGAGNDNTGEATTYKAEIIKEDGTETVALVEVDKTAGTAYVDIEPDILTGGADITVPAIPTVESYVVSIPTTNLTTADSQHKFILNTEIGSFTVPSNMLTGTSVSDGDKAQITLSRGDKSKLPDEVKEAIGDRPLIQLTLSIDGNPVNWSNPDAHLTVNIPYTPTEEELANPEGIVVWYIDGSGNAICVPNGRYDSETGTVTFTTTHFSYYAVNFRLVGFKDVTEDAWYAKAVSFAAARDITLGTGDGYFSPEAMVTRAQYLVMMMRAYGIDPDKNPEDNFADGGNTWYTGYLASARRLGITAGIGNNLFAPDKTITRQEMFTMLYNALNVIGKLPSGTSGKTLSDFSDAGDIETWAKDAVQLLVETGMVKGDGNRLLPSDNATRAQVVQMFYNLLSE